MNLSKLAALGLGGAAIALLLAEPSLAQMANPEAATPPPGAPVPNKGDTAWMMISSALVLMMSVPGLALFYGGLVRTKNMLSVLTQVFAIVSIAALIWVCYGYSLAFTPGGGLNEFIGGTSKVFLKGVDVQPVTLHAGAVVAFGDSITDGAHAAENKNHRWPDFLAARLHDNSATAGLAVQW